MIGGALPPPPHALNATQAPAATTIFQSSDGVAAGAGTIVTGDTAGETPATVARRRIPRGLLDINVILVFPLRAKC